MDVTKHEAMAQLCRGIHDRWGHVDLCIHSAVHAAPLAPAGHIGEKDWAKSVEINMTATATLIRMVEPLLQAAPAGRSVFFDDPPGGEKFFGPYGATKAGQIALARSWQAESERTGPAVAILSPQPMATALRARFYPGETRDALASPRDEARRLLPQVLGHA